MKPKNNTRLPYGSCSGFAIVALMLSMACALAGPPSMDGLWTPLANRELAAAPAEHADDGNRPDRFRPTSFASFKLNPDLLTERLAKARSDKDAEPAAETAGETEISLPLPDGRFVRLGVIESPVMAPELAAKFPEIRTYRGQGLDDRSVTARIDRTPGGMHAQIILADQTVIVDPIGSAEQNEYASFAKRANRGASRPFECLLRQRAEARAIAVARPSRSGTHLRTYRLAVACTGEYARAFGGTQQAAMQAIVTTINRVTGIYEKELAIRFLLVPTNDQIIFTDPISDPFSNDNARALINQSQSVIDARIGDTNYDIGHTFSTGAGGLAGLGVVGRSGQKARGVTGRSNPSGDPFDVDFVAHEIGHQFGGDHTFNGVFGSCSGANRNGPTAFEPGSGSTIQAYAGICDSDDLQRNSDPHFHSVSLDQIIEYSTTGGGAIVTPNPTGNRIPTVSVDLSNITIPHGTPFTLSATASDADGDPLTYSWEQRNLGPPAQLAQPDDGRIPLFRTFRPSTSHSRTFPRWVDILNDNQTLGEQLPSTGRTLNFRVTVRDNQSSGGSVNGADVAIKVDSDAGPFEVTAPEGTIQSRLVEVKWQVANTDLPPVSAGSVNILLSTDGGAIFDPILSDTPNDGTELVSLPATAKTNLRIQVAAADNIFFAVSPEFEIAPARARIVVVRHAEKSGGSDPDLTIEGKARADRLAQLFPGIDGVFSTNTRRTIQTATPSAVASGKEVQLYSDEVELVGKLKQLNGGQQVLVVGHSNTVGTILSRLGIADSIQVGENEYSRMFVTSLDGNGAAASPVAAGSGQVASTMWNATRAQTTSHASESDRGTAESAVGKSFAEWSRGTIEWSRLEEAAAPEVEPIVGSSPENVALILGAPSFRKITAPHPIVELVEYHGPTGNRHPIMSTVSYRSAEGRNEEMSGYFCVRVDHRKTHGSGPSTISMTVAESLLNQAGSKTEWTVKREELDSRGRLTQVLFDYSEREAPDGPIVRKLLASWIRSGREMSVWDPRLHTPADLELAALPKELHRVKKVDPEVILEAKDVSKILTLETSGSMAKLSGYKFMSEQVCDLDESRARAYHLLGTSGVRGKLAISANLEPELVTKYDEIASLSPVERFFFGTPESVCFPDERAQVADTSVGPWSTNCQLIITFRNGNRAIGTGWLIDPRTVITAGHCVHEGAGGNFFAQVEVIPGMNGPLRPFGSKISTNFRASSGWKTSGTLALDYGAILLDSEFRTPSGETPGYYSAAVMRDDQLDDLNVSLSGYPADKTFGTQWKDSDPIAGVSSTRLKYMLDTFGGHSGSAVVSEVDGVAVGIHNYGGCPNHCTRITASVMADLESWMAESRR